jgi:hypothetical protein
LGQNQAPVPPKLRSGGLDPTDTVTGPPGAGGNITRSAVSQAYASQAYASQAYASQAYGHGERDEPPAVGRPQARGIFDPKLESRPEQELGQIIEQGLLSSATSAAVDKAFNSLGQTVLVQNARTLEDLVKDMLRPMLKSWLDENLPGLVERLVRAEIERVSRGRS